MSIKIYGTTVIDNSRNLTSIEAAIFTGTGYIKVPSGTDAQRPVSPSDGMFRYNTTSNTFEGYVSGAWVENLHTGNITPTHIPEDATHRWTTDAEKTSWNTAYTHSQATHAPSTAQKNSDITKAEIEAKLTGTISTHTHNIDPFPIGSISFHASSTAPSGFLKCNGANVSRTTYADLFAIIGTTFGAGDGSTTFTLPDLRGEFVRGWDNGRGVDTSRVFGSAQASAFASHRHGDRDWYVYWTDQQSYHGPGTVIPHLTYDGHMYYNKRSASIDLAAGGAETRPRNVALLACIKY